MIRMSHVGKDAMKLEPEYIPERELINAEQLGSEAAIEGKPADTCPFYLTILRARWLVGYNKRSS